MWPSCLAQENELSSYDIQQIAIGEEYNIFTSNKVVTMYRRGMAFLMADIKGKTDKYIAHSVLSNFKPTEKPYTPPDPQKKITGFSGFQTALQMSKKSDLPKDDYSLPKKDIESQGTYYLCTFIHVSLFFLYCSLHPISMKNEDFRAQK